MLSSPEIAVAMLAAGVAASVGLYWSGRQAGRKTETGAASQEPLSMLFDAGVLHHGTATALRRFALIPGAHLWDDLHETLAHRFPAFPDAPGDGEAGCITLHADDADDIQRVEISWRGPLCWVTCSDRAPSVAGGHDPAATASKLASETTPHPAWQTDRKGDVIWHNTAYQSLFQKVHGRLPDKGDRLFDPTSAEGGTRAALHPTQGDPIWFELISQDRDGWTMHHATSIDALVKAEDAQRSFVQTLAKTFAHLPIGLAVFDRDDQLFLFNPAMLELSALPVAFLTARPTMLSFFDQLRENRRMPEPKNYGAWRKEIMELVAAAADGRYRETWSLEDGRTYSVQGRPHPDGATVFLFEDISAEISLTRNFRSELEMTQHLLDKVEDAMAVFSPSGILTFCNRAYRDLWQQKPDAAFADVTIADCVAIWRQTATTDLGWQRLLTMPGRKGPREPLNGTVTLHSGLRLSCVCEPIASGGTLMRFRAVQEVATALA
ncbi:hypothetical protein BOO69_17885 [Sulfitobacter alexandrii]|uniref:PAS domain-containing protein n=1 Tax=Sulfitobacter alexandrii TaxID=1917485 RepID=A0A1J0WMK8_9RHOB|nr:hypothetical protein BOO69_17885 [Sulfitobacter alexandrii]